MRCNSAASFDLVAAVTLGGTFRGRLEVAGQGVYDLDGFDADADDLANEADDVLLVIRAVRIGNDPAALVGGNLMTQSGEGGTIDSKSVNKMPRSFSRRVWDGEQISLRVVATGREFCVRRKFNPHFCVRGFAVFERGRRVSPYRILGRETLENWLDTGELVEVS